MTVRLSLAFLTGRWWVTTINQSSEVDVANIALAIIGIVKAHHIVDVWSNDIAQNNMRNAIDDYFFDVLRDQRGIHLPVELMDDLELRIMDLARARFPG